MTKIVICNPHSYVIDATRSRRMWGVKKIAETIIIKYRRSPKNINKGVSAFEKKKSKKKEEKRKSQKKKKEKKENPKKEKIGHGPFYVPKGRMRKNPGKPGKKEAVWRGQPAPSSAVSGML